MKFYSTLLLALLTSSAWAQNQSAIPIPDTLDWHRYFPLTIGNIWEYQVSEGEPLRRHQIIGDTLAGDHRYAVLVESIYEFDSRAQALELWSTNRRYVRYDSIGAVFVLPDPEADTLETPRDVALDGETQGYFDLRMAFDDTLYYGTASHAYYVTSGGYGEWISIGAEEVEVAALKVFESTFWRARYAADIGYLGGGNLWGPFLTYARVGEAEYGIGRTPTSVEAGQEVELLSIGSIFPNPARSRVRIGYGVSRPSQVSVEVFNVLGQRVWSRGAVAQGGGMHRLDLEVEAWPPGLYVVSIRGGDGIGLKVPFLIVR